MRWIAYCGVIAAATLISNDRVSGPAFAVMPDVALAPAAPVTTTPATPLAMPTRLDLPVAWQLTRSKLMGPGSTLTESFRETWTLELTPSGRLFLASPRARVPAFAEEARPRAEAAALPHTVILSELDLAQLVGIDVKDGQAADQDEPAVDLVGRPVTLSLRQTRGGLDVSLSWSDEEHFALHLDIGNTATF